MLVAAIVAGVLCSVVWGVRYYVWGRGRGRLRVPGPRGLPIIGNIHQLLSGSLPIHHTLALLSHQYGPLMRVQMGAIPMLVASSADLAKLILHTHDKIFSGRPQYISAERIFTQPGRSFIFSQPTPYWRLIRQLIATDVFSNSRLRHLQAVREDEIQHLLLLLSANQASPLYIGTSIRTTVSNIISRMIFGKRLSEILIANIDVVALMTEVVSLTGAGDLGDFIPGIAWMDLQGLRRRSKLANRHIQTVFQEVIDTRRRSGTNQPPSDLLDSLLLASTDPKHKDLQIDDRSIINILLAMFAGGIDTTSSNIEWALVELLVNPDKLEKAQEELTKIVGASQIVRESDMPHLPYFRATMYEVARLHPVGPLLLPHMTLEACELGGYWIPTNTPLLVNAWAIHRDPSLWENPLKFSPERFLKSTLLDASPGQHFEFLPFGSGRRMCPAWKLALISAQSIVANLIHAFDLATLHGKPSMKEKATILAPSLENPLVVVLTCRWPQHAFSEP